MTYCMQIHPSPIGKLILVSREDRLCGVIFESMWPRFERQFADRQDLETPILKETKQQIDAYLAGHRQSFDLPFELQGTDFQKRVWTALGRIPYGQTRTYKEQAVFIQSPGAARAVGRADGLNPLSLVLPCHRVLGSTGALTGYAGGLEAKQFLLRLEADVAGRKRA